MWPVQFSRPEVFELCPVRSQSFHEIFQPIPWGHRVEQESPILCQLEPCSFMLLDIGMQYRSLKKSFWLFLQVVSSSLHQGRPSESCILELHCLAPCRISFTDLYFVTVTVECSRSAPRRHHIHLTLVSFIAEHHLYL